MQEEEEEREEREEGEEGEGEEGEEGGGGGGEGEGEGEGRRRRRRRRRKSNKKVYRKKGKYRVNCITLNCRMNKAKITLNVQQESKCKETLQQETGVRK